MTLRTITFDDLTHKIVPREPTEEMMFAYQRAFISEKRFDGKEVFKAMVAAAPEYQEPERLCDDGGKCGAGGYCITCPKLKG